VLVNDADWELLVKYLVNYIKNIVYVRMEKHPISVRL
jgi:hypothetical protein